MTDFRDLIRNIPEPLKGTILEYAQTIWKLSGEELASIDHATWKQKILEAHLEVTGADTDK